MRELSREKAVEWAISSVSMEGLPVTAEMRDRLRRYADGKITAAEAEAEILAKHTKRPNPPKKSVG
jgi:hypothetical protein